MRSSATALALLIVGCSTEPITGPQAAPAGPALAPPPPSSVQDISAGNPGDAHAWSINADNQVAGWSVTSRGVRGWVWAAGVRTILPLSPGASGSEAYGISADGRVVGFVVVAGQMYPAYWPSPTSAPFLLPTIGSTTGNLALGVNANGRVVGLEVDRRGHEQAFVWEASTRVFNLLGTFGGVGSRANDVNEAGTVTGCADVSSGTARAFRWTPSSGLTLADTYSGSTYSCGRGINRQEDVAGLFVGAGATGTDTAAVFDASGIPLLAARAGGPALYWSVNDNGLAVGSADASGLRQAIVYQPGVGINVLPPLTSGGGAEARDINGCGRIVGSGYAGSGPYRALMWVPVKC